MRSLAPVLALTALISSSSASSPIKYINHCPYDVRSWTVGPAASGYWGDDDLPIAVPPASGYWGDDDLPIAVPPTSAYWGDDDLPIAIPANTTTISHMLQKNAIGSRVALKLQEVPKSRAAPDGTVGVEFNLGTSKSGPSYHLNAVNCTRDAGREDPSFCPLIRSGLKVRVEDDNQVECSSTVCSTDGCNDEVDDAHSCDAGIVITIEFCTERVEEPRASHHISEPKRSVEYNAAIVPGYTTTDGVCGLNSPRGATCILYEHGNCCSSYGWCGFSEAHCGEGCQKGFGYCFGETEQYSSYSDPRVPPESTQAPVHSHIEYTWPSYVKPSTSYHHPSSIESMPGYSEPTHEYNAPSHVHSTSTPIYDTPTPSHYTPAQSYQPPAPSYSAPHSPEDHKTVYATHTVTHTSKATKTVTITSDEQYNTPPTSAVYPAPSSEVYEAPSPSYEQSPSYQQPSSYEQPSNYREPSGYEHPSSHEAPPNYEHLPTHAVTTTVYQTITVTTSPELPLASSSWFDAYTITSVHKVTTTPAAYSQPAYMTPA